MANLDPSPPLAPEPLRVLVADDEAIDVLALTQALRRHQAHIDTYVTTDGEATLAFLRREPPFEDVPRPDIVLLDLHMPGRHGFEVLQLIKEDEHLCRIPVVVLSGMLDEHTVARAYALHAATFVAKPRDSEGFEPIVRSILDFWLRVALLPSRGSGLP